MVARGPHEAGRAAPWRTVASTQRRIGFLDIRRDIVETDAGERLEFGYMVHPGAVLVVAVADGDVLLVDHYRQPAGRWCLEVPAGRARSGEPAAVTAARELEEETGAVAGDLVDAGGFFASTGSSSEWCAVFVGRVARFAEPALEPGEVLRCRRVAIADALDMARRGGIHDGPSALALLMAESHLAGGGEDL